MIVLFFLLFFGTIMFLVFYFSKEAVIKRKLNKVQATPINQCQNGEEVKIIGEVEIFGEPLVSPLSDRECCHYYVLVEQKVSSGKSSKWKKIIEEEKSSHVMINDGTGKALIDTTTRLKSHIVQDANFKSGFMNDATDKLENYLNQHNIKSEGFFGFNKTIRYKEGILEQGEAVAVLGKAEWRNLESSDEDRILTIRAAEEGGKVYLSDDEKVTRKK